MRIKVWLIVALMAVGLLGLGTLADSWTNNGDRRVSVENLTHKPGHKRPPGCDKTKGKGYQHNQGKKCKNHNGGGNSNNKSKGKGKK